MSRRCPCCGASGAATIGATPALDRVGADVALVVCGTCAHWFHHPSPDQPALDALYAAGSPRVVAGADDGTSPTSAAEQDRHTALFERLVGDLGPITYLELGIGSGELFQAMAARTDHAVGVEPGPWAPREDRVVTSLAAVPTDLGADLVVALDVVEHVADPTALLGDLRKRAADHAVLVVTVPNAESRAARALRARWRMVRPYGHLHYFTRASMAVAMSAAGWDLRSAEPVRTRLASRGDVLRDACSALRHRRVLSAAARLAYGLVLGGRDQWLLVADAGTLRSTI